MLPDESKLQDTLSGRATESEVEAHVGGNKKQTIKDPNGAKTQE